MSSWGGGALQDSRTLLFLSRSFFRLRDLSSLLFHTLSLGYVVSLRDPKQRGQLPVGQHLPG